jgi:hypothetical protein
MIERNHSNRKYVEIFTHRVNNNNNNIDIKNLTSWASKRHSYFLYSNLSPETGYSDGRFHCFSQSLQAVLKIVPQITSQTLPSTSCYYLLIVVPLNAI